CIDIGCGVFTSVSGSAPHRIFNIEWRSVIIKGPNIYVPIYFEVRLYEDAQKWDVVYSQIDTMDIQNATIGAQKGLAGPIVQYQCPGSPGNLNPGDMLTFDFAFFCPTSTP